MKLSPIALLRRLGLRRFIQFVAHLPSFVKLFSRLVRDPRVSLSPKLILLAVLAYVILSGDLVPDFLSGLGQVDDLLVIFLGLNLFLRLCPRAIVREHVQVIAAGR